MNTPTSTLTASRGATHQTPPPGAIVPPRVGPIGLDLPDGWWLVQGENAGELDPEVREAAALDYCEDPDMPWLTPQGYPTYAHVAVRRRTVQVTVDAQPGDRIIVLDLEAYQQMLLAAETAHCAHVDVGDLLRPLGTPKVVE